MSEAAVNMLDQIVPASDFNHGKANQAFSKVSVGRPVIVVKRSVPAYVVITPDEYRDYKALRHAREDEREDEADLALAERRLANWDGGVFPAPRL